MPKIELTTEYDAPIQVVFDANRNIDLHELSAMNTDEKAIEGKTKMYEVFDYESPFGILGKLADNLFLKSYMKRFLETRNNKIKAYLKKGNNIW